MRYANNPSRSIGPVNCPAAPTKPRYCLAGAVELPEKLDHADAGLEVGVRLEPVEDLAGEDLLTGLGDQPVVEEDRRPLVAHAARADLGLPEPGLELLPVLLVRRFDVGAGLDEPLEDEVLDQVSGGQLRTAGVEGLEDLLRVLIGGQVDDHHLHQFANGALDRAGTRLNVLHVSC